MKIAERILEEVKDDLTKPKTKLNTRVRGQVEKYGSRASRLMVQEAIKILENMSNPNHNSPNPKTQTDLVYMKEAIHIGKEMVKKIKPIQETKRKTESFDLTESLKTLVDSNNDFVKVMLLLENVSKGRWSNLVSKDSEKQAKLLLPEGKKIQLLLQKMAQEAKG